MSNPDQDHLEFLSGVARGDLDRARLLAVALRAAPARPSGFPRRESFLAHLDREILIATREQRIITRGVAHVRALQESRPC